MKVLLRIGRFTRPPRWFKVECPDSEQRTVKMRKLVETVTGNCGKGSLSWFQRKFNSDHFIAGQGRKGILSIMMIPIQEKSDAVPSGEMD